MRKTQTRPRWLIFFGCLTIVAGMLFVGGVIADPPRESNSVLLSAPAGTLAATMHATIDGYDAAVLPTGRIVTPIGTEVSVGAPKPYGMALSPEESMLAT